MTRPTAILGISAFYHDSAAALVLNGEIVAAAQEERFTRVKHDAAFPRHAVRYVLEEAGIGLDDLAAVAFYEKPLLKFERLVETFHAVAPRGLPAFLAAMPVWAKKKLFMRRMLRRELEALGGQVPRLLFPEHHLSHAASAFFPSPFGEAAVITVDGVGEWACTTIGLGRENGITILKEQQFPHSLGLLYSAFTHYCGFRVNDGEYKLMGLAPYGSRERFTETILRELVDLREDGSFALNMDYFGFLSSLTMTRDRAWERLFGLPRRDSGAALTSGYCDLAAGIQQVTEEVMLRLARTARELTGCDRLVMAGGVGLNCVANGRILREGIFRDIWVQPAAGDAGGALGAALAAWHTGLGNPRNLVSPDAMQGSLLGPRFDEWEIRRLLKESGVPFREYPDFGELCRDAASLISEGNVVGWFQGRMEYGPRALGNRSILADPRDPEMQRKLNLKIKFREGFRPFAPAVSLEHAADWFDLDRPSPYMLFVAPVREELREQEPEPQGPEPYLRAGLRRSAIPAVTHVDYSARVQTVDARSNPEFSRLIESFRELTGCPILVNTSFNVNDEPIVCTPEDAWRCFQATGMDFLVMGRFLVGK